MADDLELCDLAIALWTTIVGGIMTVWLGRIIGIDAEELPRRRLRRRRTEILPPEPPV